MDGRPRASGRAGDVSVGWPGEALVRHPAALTRVRPRLAALPKPWPERECGDPPWSADSRL